MVTMIHIPIKHHVFSCVGLLFKCKPHLMTAKEAPLHIHWLVMTLYLE